MKKAIPIIFILASGACIWWCFNYFSHGDLTSKEQILFSVFLTVASIFLSWIISHFYYEVAHQQNIADIKKDYQSNLKVYASKAAEKVTNLSAEFNKLVNYLKEEYDDNEYDSDIENLNAKKERIYSVIHIVNTLKSINDGSLSDWKGIIPEEIEEIAEEEREKVENINTLLSRYQSVVRSSEIESDFVFKDEALKEDISELNRKLDIAINNVAGVMRKAKKETSKKEKVEKHCPKCDVLVQYKQRPLPTSRKWIKCKNCDTKLACRWDVENGFSLVVFDPEIHEPKSLIEKTTGVEIDDAFVELIRIKLPAQPWPKKAGESLAVSLGIPPRDVQRAISILIERGIFKHQVNGVLYVPETRKDIADQVGV